MELTFCAIERDAGDAKNVLYNTFSRGLVGAYTHKKTATNPISFFLCSLLDSFEQSSRT